jgi:hypothetical protein
VACPKQTFFRNSFDIRRQYSRIHPILLHYTLDVFKSIPIKQCVLCHITAQELKGSSFINSFSTSDLVTKKEVYSLENSKIIVKTHQKKGRYLQKRNIYIPFQTKF